jgi:hypothetical protein
MPLDRGSFSPVQKKDTESCIVIQQAKMNQHNMSRVLHLWVVRTCINPLAHLLCLQPWDLGLAPGFAYDHVNQPAGRVLFLQAGALHLPAVKGSTPRHSCVHFILFFSISFKTSLISFPSFHTSQINAHHILYLGSPKPSICTPLCFHSGILLFNAILTSWVTQALISNHPSYLSVTPTNSGNDSHPTSQFHKARANKSTLRESPHIRP